MSLPDLLIIALATWRVATMAVNEQGPFDVFARLRTLPYPIGSDTERTGVLDCVACFSVWTAAAMVGLWLIGYAGAVIVVAFAVSGAAMLVEGIYEYRTGT